MQRIRLRHLRGSRAAEVDEFPVVDALELLLGRDPSASVRFDPERDDLVGRRHARIVTDPEVAGGFLIMDLDSLNGTFVNRDRVVGRVALRPGDVVGLGADGPELLFDLLTAGRGTP